MRLATESAQHVDRVRIATGQLGAVAYADHLRAALLVGAFLTGDMSDVERVSDVGDIDNRGAVKLRLAGERIDRFRHRVGSAVMADIGEPSIAFPMNGRSIGAPPLQI